MEQPLLDNTPTSPQPEGTPLPPPQPAPWTLADTWLGLGMLIFIVVGFLLGTSFLEPSRSTSIFVVAVFEFLLLIPIAVIFLWRKVSWTELGLRRFENKTLALGCGLLIAAYFVVMINNLIMTALGVMTQADVIAELLGELESPLLFAFVTAFVAPLTEEIFFRGFLFKGFRQRYGWVNAMLLSSFIFALFHGQVATLIPTFLLGALFAYMYQRTESVFPGMILHFAVNAMGAMVLLAANQMGAL